MAASDPIRKCHRDAEAHLGLGTNVLGAGPTPYDPHAHPFGGERGLVACCTESPDCYIEGHLTRDRDGTVRHTQG